MKRRLHWNMLPALVVLAGGCDAILGLEKATLFQPDAGAGTTTTGTTTSGTGGAGGGTSSSSDSASSSSGTGGSSIECVSGQKQCAGNLPQSCDGTGHWQDGTECAAETPFCVAGFCGMPPSCVGLPPTCGPGNNESCCASPIIPKGTYNRINDGMYPATVSSFRLDRFEITVGRFRKFFTNYPGNKPKLGAGEHPSIPESGWQESWNANLPADQAALNAVVKCNAQTQTWTDIPGGNENKPMNCIAWYEAFAFCAWDGGRLPTEAEWNYAAAGGDEQREYPWSNPPDATVIDSTYAVYNGALIPAVGSTSAKGDGKWGQADLGGDLWEWNLDWYLSPYAVSNCDNCATLVKGTSTSRVARGGSWFGDGSLLLTSFRTGFFEQKYFINVGARCARLR